MIFRELIWLEPKESQGEAVESAAATEKPLVEDTAHDSEDTASVAQSSIVKTQYNPASQAGSQEEDSDSTTNDTHESQTAGKPL